MQIGGIALYSALFNKCLNTPSNHDINMYLHTTKTKIIILLEAECEKIGSAKISIYSDSNTTSSQPWNVFG